MKLKIKAILGVALCAILGCVLFVGCNDNKNEESENTVKEAKTIEVATAEDLLGAAKYVGKEYSQYTIKLTADIDLSSVEWKPIGLTLNKAFCGTFDGNGKTISGLKITGWENDGTPKYIAKQIIGWLSDGTPVYKSSEILSVDKGEQIEDNNYAVKSYVLEGDDADPNYVAIDDGNGTFETDVAYGSVGLFGYTFGATVRNLNVSGADISFYTSGDYSYAGVISGYDVGSKFETVVVTDSKISVSTIYDREISYYDNYGTPAQFKDNNNNNQYVGGIIGYAKSNTQKGQETKVNSTILSDVTSNGFIFDNTNYCAFYDGGLRIYGDKENAKLVIAGDTKGGYSVSKIDTTINVSKEFFPVQLYVGGTAGYISGAKLNDVTVDGFNKATNAGEKTNKLSSSTQIIARSVYAAGIAGGIYSSTANTSVAKNIYVNGIYWRDWDYESFIGLIYDKATIGGGYGIVGKSEIKNGRAETVFVEVGGTNLENVCLGGFIGYEDDNSSADEIIVKDVYMYSTYTGSSELGSIMGGAAGVLRNSSMSNAEVSDVDFEISGGKKETYSFVRSIVAQAYGDSAFSESSATNIRIHKNRTEYHGDDYEEIIPLQTKNNYVNEDGYTSARLYYTVDGKYSNTFVTVYGELVPRDAYDNLLIEEEIYRRITLSGYSEGDIIETGKYYFYDPDRKGYIFIGEDTVESNKKYVPNRIYAEKISVYRVEIAQKNKNFSLSNTTYYNYVENEAKFEVTSDTVAKEGKTYYINKDNKDIASYYLDITVYSESGNVIVTDEKNKENEDDDILAKARYSLTKEEVNNATKTDVCGDKTYALANAEIFINKYFSAGTGFLPDINSFTIKYYDSSIKNRDFSKYRLVSGRPFVDEASITYKKDNND